MDSLQIPNPKSQIPNLAVVILTWNGRSDSLACLESLEAGGHPREGEAFVVVDNGSADGTLEAVQERFPWAVCLRNEANLGFAGGNNVGLRWALDRGFRLVMLLNNDTEVPAGTLGALAAFLDANPRAGAVQPLLVLHSDRERVDSSGQELFSLPGARDRGIGTPVSEAPQSPQEIFGACAAAALYRAEALRKTSLLDEDFFVLLEDVDLSFQLRLAGYDAFLVPGARLYHKRGISSQGKLHGEKKYLLHRNVRALALRYWPGKYLALYAPFLAKGWLWGAAYAVRNGRWGDWSRLMKRSRRLRRQTLRNPQLSAIQSRWMQPLGAAYYWKKLRERLTGRPAIPVTEPRSAA